MKVHHIAHYEYGIRPHSEMREKEFPTQFCEEWRRDHWYFGGAAWARPITANDVLAAAVIKKILSNMIKKILALKEYWSLINEISDYLREDHDTITTKINGVEYVVYKRLNPDYVEFLNNETKEVTFVDIIDEPTEVSSLLVQSAVNEIRYRKG